MKARIERGSLGARDEGYTVHINITAIEPWSDCEDYLDFKNLREFIEYIRDNGDWLLEKMDECEVEIVFRGKNGDWATTFDERTAIIRLDIGDLESEELKKCHEKLEKIREIVM